MSERGIYNYRELSVIRMEPVMVCPAKETPKEVLYLSNIDDQPILRSTNKGLLVYVTSDADPAVVIRDALSRALVYYYPFAGRFRKTQNAKLEMNCNGEGAVFLQGNANCSLKDVGYLAYPTSFSKHLFYQFPETYEYHDIPPLVIQVTVFVCGGFTVTFAISHCMADAAGMSQFVHAIAQLARGMTAPSINPVWKRDLLAPRNPPQIGFHHPEFEVIQSRSSLTTNKSEFLIEGSFHITAPSVAKLKQKVLEEGNGSLKSCSRFEALAAFVWKARVKALRFPSDQRVQLLFAINARRIFNPPLPEGYYGNAIVSPCITLYAKELSEISLGELVQIIRKKKVYLRDEYLRSTIDFLEVHRERLEQQGLPSNVQLYLTDLTRMKPLEVDFGWGSAINVCDKLLQDPDGSFLPPLAIGNHKMKDAVRFVTCLPPQAMFTFKLEMQRLLDLRCAL